MSKINNAIILFLMLLFAVCFVSTTSVYASNGTRELGFSARDSAMAGSTVASPADTSCLVENPASLVWIGNRIDAVYQNILPHDVSVNPEGPDVLGKGIPIANRGIKEYSTTDYIPAGDAGISYRIPGTDAHPVSVGCGIFTISGLEANYPSSVINSALIPGGAYDKMAELMSVRIAPGIAVAFNDKLSFGATSNIEIQGFRTNTATANFNLGTFSFPETAGGGSWDFAAGGGFTLGLLYKFNEMLNLGASYESHTWMNRHYDYKDAMPCIDEPQVVNFGTAIRPINNLEWTTGIRYINWTGVKIMAETPAKGGVGWDDQWVFMTGAEYTFKDKKDNDKLKLRIGYNYGKSPIQQGVVFANSLFPLVMEHHLTMGFSYFLKKDLSLDFVWEHHFTNVMVDNGAGDSYSINGNGTKVTASADIISAGLGYKF